LIPLSSSRPGRPGKYLLFISSFTPLMPESEITFEFLTGFGNKLSCSPLSAGRRRNEADYSPSLAPPTLTTETRRVPSSTIIEWDIRC
jgi:hypothetical protein